MLIFVHFGYQGIAKANLNHFMTFAEPASDDLKMASEVKYFFFYQKKAEVMKNIAIGHSSSEDVILG